MKENFLGFVKNGEFKLLYPRTETAYGSSTRLTEDHMNVGREIIELDLTEYEEKAILVSGDNKGSWMYGVEIIEQAGPHLTSIIKQIFNIDNESQ